MTKFTPNFVRGGKREATKSGELSQAELPANPEWVSEQQILSSAVIL